MLFIIFDVLGWLDGSWFLCEDLFLRLLLMMMEEVFIVD